MPYPAANLFIGLRLPITPLAVNRSIMSLTDPTTRGLGEYPLADARDVANEEAGRLGLSVVDLTRIPQTT